MPKWFPSLSIGNEHTFVSQYNGQSHKKTKEDLWSTDHEISGTFAKIVSSASHQLICSHDRKVFFFYIVGVRSILHAPSLWGNGPHDLHLTPGARKSMKTKTTETTEQCTFRRGAVCAYKTIITGNNIMVTGLCSTDSLSAVKETYRTLFCLWDVTGVSYVNM